MLFACESIRVKLNKGDKVIITIIDYRAGNAPSVAHAITRLGKTGILAHSAREIKNASHIILPGVGSAKATMESLRELELINALEEAVLRRKTFFLGICVGMQILFEHSEEEDTGCLGWLCGNVIKFDAAKIRVPQMGWNQVKFCNNSLSVQDDYFYFVNSYYARAKNDSDIWGTADYQQVFTAAVHRDNIFATQFHVEKSGEAGLELLDAFLKLKGDA